MVDQESLQQSADRQVLSVSELTAQVKEVLEGTFPSVWVSGEISNFSRPQSGHCYFTLKDEHAQLRAVMWRGAAARVRFDLEDGIEVVCRGHLDVYAPRGSYQLVVEGIEPKGVGALELALRKLRDKLAAEGLFDPARKRPLPGFPRRVAFVTSPTGAAIRDFLEVAARRFRGVDVLMIPARVQGTGAAKEIAAGIAAANQLALPIDVLIVGRGGGSLEDLWSFNEEIVVRAVAASRIPVVSAVGHEIDVTLSDLAADVRALTPSEAAERVVPSADEIMGLVNGYRQRLLAALRQRVERARARVERAAEHRAFRRPFDRVFELERRLDELGARSDRSMRHLLQAVRGRIDTAAARLETLSPLGVLGRGYSLTQRVKDGGLVRDAGQLSPGEQIATRLARGRIVSRVEEIEKDVEDSS